MKNLITFCIRRPVTVIMLILALLMGAVYSVNFLPLDKLPEIIYPNVTVETFYPGMGAAEVRSGVTIPLEDSLSSVKGLQGLRSVSRDGESVILLAFRWGSDPARAAALTREAVDTVYPGLPRGVSKPTVIFGNPDDEAHAIVAVRARNGDNSFAGNLAEYELRAMFRRIDGAGRVSVTGGEKQEIRIRADPARLAARSLDGGDLAGKIAFETGDFPAGSAREGFRELTVVSTGRPRSREELASLVLSAGNSPLNLADIAVTETVTSSRKSLFIFQNVEQTALEIYRRPGADPVRLSREIKKIADESSALFSRDAEIRVVFDSSPSIISGIRDLVISGSFAALAVILLLAFFLGRLRCSLLAALSLPFSGSAALVALAAAGRSLNSMSLAGLALGIGLVSDTSVIVLDLFCRRFGTSGNAPPPLEAGAAAASVSLSSLAGALTTTVVFVPVIFLPGPLGALFGDLAFALVFSVAAGWLYAQFCLPSLFCFIRVEKFNKPPRYSGTGKLERTYDLLLKKVFVKPSSVLLISVTALIAGIVTLCFRPMEFITPGELTEIEVSVDFPCGTTVEGASAAGIAVSETLSALPGVSFIYGRMGAEDDDKSRRADPDYRKERLLFRCFLENGSGAGEVLEAAYAGVNALDIFRDGNAIAFNAGYPADHTARVLGLSSPMTLAVKGGAPEETARRSGTLADTLRRKAGSCLESIRARPSGTRPQLRLLPRREQAASLGVSVSRIAGSLYAASEGIVTGSMEIEGRPLDIRFSLTLPKDDPETLKKLPLSVSSSARESGLPVFLGSLVDIEWIESEPVLARQDRSDVIYLDLFPAAGKEKQIRKLLNETAGKGVSRADESVFGRYRTALAATVLLVLLLLYLTLGAQFESFTLPFVLMLSVLFSMAGAGPALLLSGSPIDSGAVIGLVALFGLAVNNGIVFYEISEEKTRGGLSPPEAVFSGALERFRPVLLTTLTTVFALLPLVVSPLGNSQRSMAVTMLGGIIVSGLLAFFAFPPVFVRFLKSKKAKDAL